MASKDFTFLDGVLIASVFMAYFDKICSVVKNSLDAMHAGNWLASALFFLIAAWMLFLILVPLRRWLRG